MGIILILGPMPTGESDPSSDADATPAALMPPRPSVAALRDAATRCRGCDLWEHATQTVFGAVPARATIVLVGEQPGDSEDRAGAPFVGPAGALLDRALDAAGIDRDRVYVTNAVKHFKWEAAGKRRIHKKPTAREIAACRPWLDAEIAVVRPHAIVCLGATAAQALLGSAFRVSRDRGRFVASSLAPRVLATAHPAAVLRSRDDRERRLAMAQLVRPPTRRPGVRRRGRTARGSGWRPGEEGVDPDRYPRRRNAAISEACIVRRGDRAESASPYHGYMELLQGDETAKVLIADDNADVRDALSAFVECIGKEAVGAADGEEALALARSQHPSVILLDLMMPKMDGWAVGRALQRDPKLSHIPFIVLSAQVDVERAETMGAAAALQKPPDLNHLARLITCLCEMTDHLPYDESPFEGAARGWRGR